MVFMRETFSYEEVLPQSIRGKYSFLETRNASKILQATNLEEFSDIISVLDGFALTPELLMTPGGNRGLIPKALDGAFRALGWQEARIDILTQAYRFVGTNMSFNGETDPRRVSKFLTNSVYQTGYKVDNTKGRAALDVEWNAKDGNLDRDLSAYRSWFEQGEIDAAILITKVHHECRQLCNDLWSRFIAKNPEYSEQQQPVNLNTSTTTTFENVKPRILRGDAGSCPMMVVGISLNTWDGSECEHPLRSAPAESPTP